jgi:hypothetical protein
VRNFLLMDMDIVILNSIHILKKTSAVQEITGVKLFVDIVN